MGVEQPKFTREEIERMRAVFEKGQMLNPTSQLEVLAQGLNLVAYVVLTKMLETIPK